MLNSITDIKSILTDPSQSATIQMLIECFNESYFIVDTEFRYLAFNSIHSKNFKSLYNVDIKTGDRFTDFLPVNENHQYFIRKLNSVLQKAQQKIVFKAGSTQYNEKWIEVKMDPVLDRNENVVAISIHITDITEQQKREQKYSVSEKTHKIIIETALDGWWMVDETGKILEVNQSLSLMTGFSNEELLQMYVSDVENIENSEEVRNHIQQTREKGYDRFESQLRCKNGNIIDVEVSLQCESGSGLIFAFFRDITEKKNNEKMLLNNERKFRNFFENSIVAKSITQIDGSIFPNEAFCNLLGYTFDELKSIKWMDISHPDELEVSQRKINELIEGKSDDFSCEKRYIHKNGNIVWVDLNTILLRDENGHPLQFFTELVDITERKIVEKNLLESEQKFRDIFDYSVIGLLVTTIDGYFTPNQAFANITGYTKSELAALNWRDISHPDDVAFNEIIVKSILNGEKKSARWKKRYIHKDGHIIWADISTTLLRDEKDEPLFFVTSLNDITQQVESEEKLKESENRFRQIFEMNYSVMFLLEAETGKILDANPAACEFYGWTYDEMLQKKIWDINVISEGEALNTIKLATTSEHKHFNFVHQKADKTLCDVDVYATVIQIYGKTVLHIIIHDITEQKKASELIKKTIERLDRAERVSKSGNWELEIETRRMKTSKGAELIYGIAGDDFDYDYIKKASLDEYRSKLDIEMKNLIEKNIPYDIEFKIRTADKGEIRDIHSTAYYDEMNKTVFGVIQDITDKKKAELKLRESEHKLSTLFANMSEMVVIHELVTDETGKATDYKIIECNDAFTEITGIRYEDCVGKLATFVYHTPEAPYLDIYAKVSLTGESYSFQTYFEPFDKHFLVSAVSLGQNRFSTISNDITEIQKSNDEVIRTNRELENYMYVTSHDLRSPLVNIQGFSQRLSRQNLELNNLIGNCHIDPEKSEKLKELSEKKIPDSLQYIQTNVAKMDKLIHNLLQISRTGRLAMNLQVIDMNRLLSSVISSFNYQLTDIKANVKINDLHVCNGDENQLNQLFSNLIGNSIKYRSPERLLKIEINSKLNFNKVLYTIHDNGIGIEPRHLERIWDVFYRVDASDPNAGDGIGLSLAKRIVEKHKGKIWVESVINEGSTFYIELPV